MRLSKRTVLMGMAVVCGAIGLWLCLAPPKTTVAPPEPSDKTDETANLPPDSAPARTGQGAHPVGNDVPIVFYGRLEDQAAEPVTNADIFGTIVYHQGTGTGTNHYSATTDVDGRFRLAGGMGDSLELLPQKPGYALASTNTFALYGRSRPESERYHADPSQPIIIKMWKLQGAEPLTAFSGRYRYYPGGTPLRYDFVAQTPVQTNGDIKIGINRPAGVISPGERPEWSVELEVEGGNGGVMEVTAGNWATTYWAPVDGYQEKQVLVVSTNSPSGWSPTASAYYFVQTRHGGVYTKMSLRVGLNLDPTQPASIELSGVVNTNGSCNWEGTLR